jgi:predicted metal-dependent HD superfamily phosphohydrolase
MLPCCCKSRDSELLPVESQIEDWDRLVLAVAYHDVIYNVVKHNNEEKSKAIA